jgi:hypothetical protein
MRKFLLGLAGFAVIAFAASVCFADDDETGGLDLSKLFGAAFQDEDKATAKCGMWGQMRFDYSNGTYSFADGRPIGGNETFRSMRFRFLPKVTYKWLSFGCQYETDSTLTLLDFWANIECQKFDKGMVNLKMGQFIPPFGLQRPISPYKILTINYSNIVSYLFGAGDPYGAGWANLRDQGIMLHGKKKLGEGEGFLPSIQYGLGFFMGEPANATTNSDPAWTTFFTLKVEPVEGMLFGLSYEDGSRADAFLPGDVARQINRDRFGLCWKMELLDAPEDKGKLLLIQGEYIVGNQNPADLDKHDDEVSPATMWHNKRQTVDGWYLEVGYYVMPQKLQLTGKVDILDLPAYWGVESRDPGVEHDLHYRKIRTYGLGLNWYLTKHCKVQVMWEQFQDEGRGKIPKISGSEHRAYVLFGVNY